MPFVAIAAMEATAHAQSIVRVDVANDGTESNGSANSADVSDDGTKVVFTTYVDGLVPEDANQKSDVYLRDLITGTTTLVSARPDGNSGNAHSGTVRVSADGRFVAFDSDASDLVAGDNNNMRDVFLRDLAAGTTQRISVSPAGKGGNKSSYLVAISADGNRVLFWSYATNLVSNDTNGFPDLFLRDVATATTTRVSDAADGTEGDGGSGSGDLSRDGNFVLFESGSDNLVPGDGNEYPDAFLRDVAAGTLVRVSVDDQGNELEYGSGNYSLSGIALSPDGRYVAFATLTDGLVPDDDNFVPDVFLRDLAASTMTIVSVDSEGGISPDPSLHGSAPRAISSDGRFVLFDSYCTRLVADGDPPGPYQDGNVFIRDRSLGMTTRQSNASDGTRSDGESEDSRMSADGLHVVFVSDATDLIDGKTTSGRCVFLVTRQPRTASSSGYGTGVAGTYGVPALSVSGPPWLNQPLDLVIGNSLGSWTAALLVIGSESADLPTGFGGDLLVLPQWTPFLALDPGGVVISSKMPPYESLASSSLFVQVLEFDPGAVEGVSFTAGLELRGGL